MVRTETGFPAPLGRRDVEDAVPYDFAATFDRERRGRPPGRPADAERHRENVPTTTEAKQKDQLQNLHVIASPSGRVNLLVE